MSDAAQLSFSLTEEMPHLFPAVGVACDEDEVGEAFERVVDLMGDGGGHASCRGELFCAHESGFGEAPVGNITENEDDANHLASAVADGSATVVDVDFGALPGYEEGVVGEAHDGSEAADFIDGAFDGVTSFFVKDTEDLVERYAFGFCFAPSGEVFGNRVHEDNVSVDIAGDDGVTDAADGRVEPLLSLVGFFAATFHLDKLVVVGTSELMKSVSCCPGNEQRHEQSKGDEADEADPSDLCGRGRPVGADTFFGYSEAFCICADSIHSLFLQEHEGVQLGGAGRRFDLAIAFLFPFLLRCIHATQPFELVRHSLKEALKRSNLRLNLIVGGVKGFKECGISRE